MRWLLLFTAIGLLLGVRDATATVAECRNQLFVQENIVAADDACISALLDDPANEEARAFRAITRLLRIAEEQQDGDDGSFTDSVKEMMDQLGLTETDRSLFGFTADFPETLDGLVILPVSSPDGGDVQEALWKLLLDPLNGAPGEESPLDASLSDLAAVGQATTFVISSEEVKVFGIDDSGVEIDYGDIKLVEAALQAMKGSLLTTLAIDLDVNIEEHTPLEQTLRVQSDVIDRNPNMFLLTDEVSPSETAESLLAEAKVAYQAAIDAYLEASQFIRSELDPQGDDLVTIPERRLASEEDLRSNLANLRISFDRRAPVLADEHSLTTELNQELGTSFEDGEPMLDLAKFFVREPFNPRPFLPPVAFDESRQPKNFIDDGSYPDPTFNGLLVPEPSAALQGLAGLAALWLLRRGRNDAQRSERHA